MNKAKELENNRRDLIKRNVKLENTIGYLTARINANDTELIDLQKDLKGKIELFNDVQVRLQNALKRNGEELTKNVNKIKSIEKKQINYVSCDFCDKMFLKSKIMAHVKTCPKRKKDEIQILKEVKEQVSEKIETLKKENGKVVCDICGNKFAPQGYKSHRIACLRRELEKEESEEEIPIEEAIEIAKEAIKEIEESLPKEEGD